MSTFRMLKNILKVCKNASLYYIVLLVLLISSSFFSTYPITYIEKAINICTDSTYPDRTKAFLIAGAIYLILHVTNVILTALLEYVNVIIETRIGHELRMKLYAKLQSVPMSFYDDKNSSDLVVRLVQDNDITVTGMLKPVAYIIKDMFVFIFGFIYMSRIDLEITLVMIPIGILISVFALKTGPRIQSLTEDERKTNSVLWQKFTENIKAIKEIKAYIQEKRCYEKVADSSLDTNKNIRRLQRYIITTSGLDSAFFMSIIAFIMIYGGYKVSIGTLSVGGLTALMMYNGLLTDPLMNFFDYYQQIQQVVVSSERIFSILEEKDETDEKEEARKIIKRDFKECLEIEDIHFFYKDIPTIDGVSMKIRKGEKIAFVGQSGCGKSTLCKLLIRFYELQEGKICLDGINIKDIRLDSLRSTIGIVFQDPFLFSGTLRENLLFANPEATEEQLQKAVEVSGIHFFLDNLENGLETYIGENGTNLSGGERQRISIARIVLKDPEILVLDESTSALDPITTMEVTRNLTELFKDKTMIFTAHKLASIVHLCDCVYMFRRGKIVGCGTHEELMEQNPDYRTLYEAQFVEE
ncbi:MAG: ABC transporter ATP-binding protein [Lachnospiraceae bacterium]